MPGMCNYFRLLINLNIFFIRKPLFNSPFRGLWGRYLIYPSLMSPAFKPGGEESVNHRQCLIFRNKSCRKRNHVGIVVSAGEYGYFFAPAKCSPDTLMFVQHHTDAVAGAANGDTVVKFTFFDSCSHRVSIIGVIAAFRAVAAKIFQFSR